LIQETQQILEVHVCRHVPCSLKLCQCHNIHTAWSAPAHYYSKVRKSHSPSTAGYCTRTNHDVAACLCNPVYIQMSVTAASCSCIFIENLRSHGTGDRDLVSHSSATPSASRAIYHQWRQRGLLGESYKFRHQSSLILATAPSHYTSLPSRAYEVSRILYASAGNTSIPPHFVYLSTLCHLSARFVSVQFGFIMDMARLRCCHVYLRIMASS